MASEFSRSCNSNGRYNKDAVGFNDSTLLEVVWIMIPAGTSRVISGSERAMYAQNHVPKILAKFREPETLRTANRNQ